MKKSLESGDHQQQGVKHLTKSSERQAEKIKALELSLGRTCLRTTLLCIH
jgi:hypothetical protein